MVHSGKEEYSSRVSIINVVFDIDKAAGETALLLRAKPPIDKNYHSLRVILLTVAIQYSILKHF